MLAARREGGNKRCFCLSVRMYVPPSVAYIAIREPKGLACPDLEGRFPTFDATRMSVLRSKVKVTRPINARAPYLTNAKAYELQNWCMMEDDDPHQTQAL